MDARVRRTRRLAAALVTALALAAPAFVATAAAGTAARATPPAGTPAVPIPQDPGAGSVTPFLGAPRAAHPLHDVRFAPRHPFMAANGRSNLHDDAYQSDAGVTPGPLGRSPEVVSTMFTRSARR